MSCCARFLPGKWILFWLVELRRRRTGRRAPPRIWIYHRDPQNLKRLADALAPADPYLRGAPPGLPFHLDVETLTRGLNFTLITNLGWIGLLGEITGGGRFEDLVDHCITIKVFAVPCMILDLPTLIQTKRAAGRPKDLEALAELEIIRHKTR